MKQQNMWEKLFDEFLDLTEFTLVRHQNDWSLIDNQGGNIGNIEGDRFQSAAEIFDRMDSYIYDYVVRAIEGLFEEAGIEVIYNDWCSLLEYKYLLKSDTHHNFNLLNMICNHADDISLENCTYEEEC